MLFWDSLELTIDGYDDIFRHVYHIAAVWKVVRALMTKDRALPKGHIVKRLYEFGREAGFSLRDLDYLDEEVDYLLHRRPRDRSPAGAESADAQNCGSLLTQVRQTWKATHQRKHRADCYSAIKELSMSDIHRFLTQLKLHPRVRISRGTIDCKIVLIE